MKTRSPTDGARVIPANSLDVGALLGLFHETRKGFIVPMRMSLGDWERYLFIHDIRLSVSALAMEGDRAVGLSLLGVRGPRAWITRMGVVSEARQRGVATRLLQNQIARCQELGATEVFLDVIERNHKARQLFESLGFRTTRHFAVLHRPPAPMSTAGSFPPIASLGKKECFDLLQGRPEASVSWRNETRTLTSAGELRGGRINPHNGGEAAIIYSEDETGIGPVVVIASIETGANAIEALATWLVQRHSKLSITLENLVLDRRISEGLQAAGFVIAFPRTEMKLRMTDKDRRRESIASD